MSYRLIKSGGAYPYQVIDKDGLPHSEMTLYACVSDRYLSPRSALAYTREIVKYANWMSENAIVRRQRWALVAPPDAVRSALSYFLTVEMKCVEILGKDPLGFETRKVIPTLNTARSLEMLLAALRSFYSVLIKNQHYSYANPFEGDEARELIDEERQRARDRFIQEHGRPPMHPDSGVDNVKRQRQSAAYFRLRNDEWIPEYIDDQSLFAKVLVAGEEWGWSLREIGIAKILFDSGCRIHEACALTMGDWLDSHFQRSFRSINKGSHGVRQKRLFITDRTVKILQSYVSEQRSLIDPYSRRLPDFEAMEKCDLDKVPLFLTTQETALSPDHFRRNFWHPALKSSGIKLRPHQCRHWFVTMGLNDIHQSAKSDEELLRLRGEFRELLGWRSDMLPAYDQARTRHNLPELAARLQGKIEEQHERAVAKLREKQISATETKKSEGQRLLEEMLKS